MNKFLTPFFVLPQKRFTLQDLRNYYADDLDLPASADDYPQSISPAEKRLSPSGFFGARGKKLSQSQNSFFGSRGKRSAQGDHIYYPSGKRIDPETFFGMRGKRTGPHGGAAGLGVKYDIEQYLGELLAAGAREEGDSYMRDDVVPSDVMMPAGDNREVEEGAGGRSGQEFADKEMLLRLVDYFLAHRFPRFDTGE